MQIEDEIFRQRRPDLRRLIGYGFKENAKGQYQLAINFFHNQFQAVMVVTQGKVTGTVIDLSTGEGYLPLRAIHPGAFARTRKNKEERHIIVTS